MSIHPQYAAAILDGSKLVEFRKRRLAADVSTVLIYATMPVGRLLGTFEIGGYDIASPTAVWNRHKGHAGIARSAYRDYFRGSRSAVGIIVSDARPLPEPLELGQIDPSLRAPQSYLYLELNPLSTGTRTIDEHLRARIVSAPLLPGRMPTA